MPPLGIPVEQLRPDTSYVRLILGAVYDIRICEEIFDGWATQLDKYVQRHTHAHTCFPCFSSPALLGNI